MSKNSENTSVIQPSLWAKIRRDIYRGREFSKLSREQKSFVVFLLLEGTHLIDDGEICWLCNDDFSPLDAVDYSSAWCGTVRKCRKIEAELIALGVLFESDTGRTAVGPRSDQGRTAVGLVLPSETETNCVKRYIGFSKNLIMPESESARRKRGEREKKRLTKITEKKRDSHGTWGVTVTGTVATELEGEREREKKRELNTPPTPPRGLEREERQACAKTQNTFREPMVDNVRQLEKPTKNNHPTILSSKTQYGTEYHPDWLRLLNDFEEVRSNNPAFPSTSRDTAISSGFVSLVAEYGYLFVRDVWRSYLECAADGKVPMPLARRMPKGDGFFAAVNFLDPEEGETRIARQRKIQMDRIRGNK